MKKSLSNLNERWIHPWLGFNELFLSVCCFDENNPSLTEIKAGIMQIFLVGNLCFLWMKITMLKMEVGLMKITCSCNSI